MKRYLIPALILVTAPSADDAAEIAGETITSLHQRRRDDLAIRMCEASSTIELGADRRDEPTDLSDYLVAANDHTNVSRALEEARNELEVVRAQLASRSQELRQLHRAASVLSEECETNGDFADEHESEVEALEGLNTVLSSIELPD